MLFRITDTDVYLCGSIHALPQGQGVADRVFALVEQVDYCVFESDFDVPQVPENALLPDGESLSRLVSGEVFRGVSKLWSELGIRLSLDDRKPWHVAHVLAAELLRQSGNSFQAGVDRQLWAAARAAGKKPWVLDSTEAMEIYDSAPLSEQIARLQYLVDDAGRASAGYFRVYEAWRAADIPALEREMQIGCDLAPATMDAVFGMRNEKWVQQILPLALHRRKALITVGAMHFAGEQSLQRLLAARGQVVAAA